jgi:dTDP-4-amino-4,6-dideoxygalactose transaminase
MIRNIFRLLSEVRKNPYFGFIQGHENLSPTDLAEIHKWVGSDNLDIIEEFEKGFAGIVGEGQAVSFASGRMGFYALMQVLGIQAGDEVVLQGATCSVMVNAVLRNGASPVYADIDPETFGSSAKAIKKVLTSQTKMIVAQHSFGIPCDIQPIVELAQAKNIFLLEDCALTLGSKLNNVVCGNFGNAALFSTDHSKPLNTLTGGLIYTQKKSLYKKLKAVQKNVPPLAKSKQHALWKQLLFERKYCRPDRYGKMKLISVIRTKIGMDKRPFLDGDFGSVPSTDYPYPAKMPTFLTVLGIHELQHWKQTAQSRKNFLSQLLNIIDNPAGVNRKNHFVAYQDSKRDIIPLRLTWSPENGDVLRKELSHFVDTSWTWFMQPVIGTEEPLENLGYHFGACSNSENIGARMVNLPCNIDMGWEVILLQSIKKCG